MVYRRRCITFIDHIAARSQGPLDVLLYRQSVSDEQLNQSEKNKTSLDTPFMHFDENG
jgi:hypothetical protein